MAGDHSSRGLTCYTTADPGVRIAHSTASATSLAQAALHPIHSHKCHHGAVSWPRSAGATCHAQQDQPACRPHATSVRTQSLPVPSYPAVRRALTKSREPGPRRQRCSAAPPHTAEVTPARWSPDQRPSPDPGGLKVCARGLLGGTAARTQCAGAECAAESQGCRHCELYWGRRTMGGAGTSALLI